MRVQPSPPPALIFFSFRKLHSKKTRASGEVYTERSRRAKYRLGSFKKVTVIRDLSITTRISAHAGIRSGIGFISKKKNQLHLHLFLVSFLIILITWACDSYCNLCRCLNSFLKNVALKATTGSSHFNFRDIP